MADWVPAAQESFRARQWARAADRPAADGASMEDTFREEGAELYLEA